MTLMGMLRLHDPSNNFACFVIKRLMQYFSESITVVILLWYIL